MSYILVLEDEALIAELIRREIAKLDDRPIELFKTAPKALKRAELQRPDIAFLDVNLRDHTSFEFAEWLYQSQTRIFFLTSYSKSSLQTIGIPEALANLDIIDKQSFFRILPEILNA